MTYFHVDDHFHNHPKILETPLEALGLWALCGSWSGDQLTDGLIPIAMLRRLGGSVELAEFLVAAGLWYVVEGGYQFHDWEVHNKTKAQVLADREKWKIKNDRRKSYRDQGDSLGETPSDTEGVTPGVTSELPGTRNKEVFKSLVLNNNKDENKDFEEFWAVYPRRVGKQAARKAFRASLSNADAVTIIEGAKRLRDDPNRLDEFTAHPSTWLNQGRWDDDPIPARASNSRNAGVDDYNRKLLQQAAQQDWVLQIEGPQ